MPLLAPPPPQVTPMVRTTDQKVPHYVVLTIPHFLIPKNSFFITDFKGTNKKIWVTMGVRGVHIDAHGHICPLAPSPTVTNQVMPMAVAQIMT